MLEVHVEDSVIHMLKSLEPLDHPVRVSILRREMARAGGSTCPVLYIWTKGSYLVDDKNQLYQATSWPNIWSIESSCLSYLRPPSMSGASQWCSWLRRSETHRNIRIKL